MRIGIGCMLILLLPLCALAPLPVTQAKILKGDLQPPGLIRTLVGPDSKERVKPRDKRDPIRRLIFSPAGDLLASIGDSGTAELWDTAKGIPLQILGKHAAPVEGIAFLPDGRSVLAIGRLQGAKQQNHCAYLWDMRSGECVHTFQPVRNTAAFTPEGTILAAADDKHDVRLWEVSTGKELRRLTGHKGPVLCVVYPRDGHMLASASSDGTVRLWHAGSGKCLATLPVHIGKTPLLWFSPDGTLLLVGNEIDRHVELFDVQTGSHLASVDVAHTTPSGICFGHGGRTLITTCGSGWFQAIDLTSGEGQLREPIVEYGGDFRRAEFSQDGNMLALGHEDGRLQLWKPPPVPTPEPLPAKLEEAKLGTWWHTLASKDANLAFQARWHLSGAATQTLALARKELSPVPVVDTKQVAAWIAQLDSPKFTERELATKKLENAGEAVELDLGKALEQKPTLEQRLRIELLLAKSAKSLSLPSGETLRTLRAIGILETIGNDEARALLRILAHGAAGVRITEVAQTALKPSNKR